MRTRVLLTSVALGAALVTGGAVTTAQAAASSSGASTTTAALAYTDIGTYATLDACLDDGEASIYSDWYCAPSTTTDNWHLWADLNS